MDTFVDQELLDNSNMIIAGFQERGLVSFQAVSVLVGALIILHRTSDRQVDIKAAAEAVRQFMIMMDGDIELEFGSLN